MRTTPATSPPPLPPPRRAWHRHLPSALPLLAAVILGCTPAIGATAVTATAAAVGAPLPRCLERVAPGFLVVREYVVLDAIPGAGLPIAPGRSASVIALLRARPTALAAPLASLGTDGAGALVVRLGERALVVRIDRAVVRADAVVVIDERLGALQALPATPAVPGGAHALAQPCAVGLGLGVGTARLFAGVRSIARSLAVRDGDVRALAELVQVPTAGDVLAELGTP